MIILKFVILQFIGKIEVVIGLLDITSTTLEVTADLEESENDEDGLAEAASKEGGSSSRRPRYTFSSSLGICGAWDPLKVGLEALSPPLCFSTASSFTSSFAALCAAFSPNITHHQHRGGCWGCRLTSFNLRSTLGGGVLYYVYTNYTHTIVLLCYIVLCIVLYMIYI